MEEKVIYLCDGEAVGCRKTTCYRNANRRMTAPICFRTSHPQNAVNFVKTGHTYTEINEIADEYSSTEKEAAEITAALDSMLRKKREKLALYCEGKRTV